LKPFGGFGKSFSYVFNTSTTGLERIVTELEIKGPCWIDVANAGAEIKLILRGEPIYT
jgi:hypothetical protein